MERAIQIRAKVRSGESPPEHKSELFSTEYVLNLQKLIFSGFPLSEVLVNIAQWVQTLQRQFWRCSIDARSSSVGEVSTSKKSLVGLESVAPQINLRLDFWSECITSNGRATIHDRRIGRGLWKIRPSCCMETRNKWGTGRRVLVWRPSVRGALSRCQEVEARSR